MPPQPYTANRGPHPRRFVFVLLDNFTLLSFAAALDCLRIANRMQEEPIYEWAILGEGEACLRGDERGELAGGGDHPSKVEAHTRMSVRSSLT